MKVRTRPQENHTIVLEKGIPIPENRGRPYSYPWKEMKVGESFLFDPNLQKKSCYQVGYDANRRGHGRFIVRKTDEGYRCWRIE